MSRRGVRGRSGSIPEYYAQQVKQRVQFFVRGNSRVEMAWRTVRDWPQVEPASVLDLGCSIGDMCWRMSVAWPRAHIVGLDLTPEYICTAEKLFGSERLEFVQADAASFKPERRFDLITMIDLYEHIAEGARASLHPLLDSALAPTGAIILTVPTPRHLAWLRKTGSKYLQPVDEDITMDVIQKLAVETGTSVVYFCEQDVYFTGDYAHAVLVRPRPWKQCTAARDERGLWQRTRRFFEPRSHVLTDMKLRKKLVRRRLGEEWLRD